MAPHGFDVVAVATITDRTGVEMEALTACATAGLVLAPALVRRAIPWHRSRT